jgi:hypothetical protein
MLKNPYMNYKVILTILFVITAYNSNSQCLDFVKTKGFQILDTEKYVPEGRYDAMVLSEGDNLSVYKTFFRGKTYRIVVTTEETITSVHFQVKTMQGQVIYDSKDNPGLKFWDYTSDKNQNLIVFVDLLPPKTAKVNSGCVAVILGYKM